MHLANPSRQLLTPCAADRKEAAQQAVVEKAKQDEEIKLWVATIAEANASGALAQPAIEVEAA